MMNAKSFITDRPVAVLMTFTAAVVFGFFSLKQLPVTLMPEMTYPTLTVRTTYTGAAPEEVENDISRPIEEALGVIGGLKQISSISRAGVSDVVLEFTWGTDMSDATQDTLEKLDLVFLPEDAERPLILHFDPSLDPIMELSFSGEGDRFEGEQGLRRLRRIAELQIKRAIEPIKGVAAVRIRGGLEEEIHVLLDEEKLRRSNLNINTVIQRLKDENINVAGGTVKEGRSEYMVRTLNEYEDLAQIEETVILRDRNRNVRVRDIGQVVRSHKEREIVTSTDGAESVQIDIYKEADANMVSLAARLKDVIGDWRPKEINPEEVMGNENRPRREIKTLAGQIFREEGAKLSLVADRSTFIKSSIDEVRNTALMGGLLAVIILFLFLRNLKTTAIIAVSIPMSLLVTFAPLNNFGVSLNIMSLGGLALGIGMLVDSSIVVLESIFRCKEEGDATRAASIRGVTEVRGAVFASTLTSIAVFFPMVFVEGIAGQAFGDLGLAVVISLLASFLVAVYFIPMLASREMPELAIGSEGQSFLYESIKRFGDDLKGLGTFATLSLVAPVYLLLRTLLQFILEIIGKFIVGIISFGIGLFKPIRNMTEVYRAPIQPFGTRFDEFNWIPMRWFEAVQKLWHDVSSAKRTQRFLGFILSIPLIVIVAMLGMFIELVATFAMVAVGMVMLIWTRALLPLTFFPIAAVFWVLLKGTNTLMDGLSSTYPRAVRFTLNHPGLVILLTLGFTWATYDIGRSLETELLPQVHQGEFTFEVALPVGTPLEETNAILSMVEDTILADIEDHEDIRTVLVTFGYDVTNTQRSDEGEHSARFKVILEKTRDPALAETRVIHRLREFFKDVPDCDVRVSRPVLFSEKTPIEVQIEGDDLIELKNMAQIVQNKLSTLPELADVETTLKAGAPEVQVLYKREQMMQMGLNIGEVARRIRDMVKGNEATRFNMKDRRVPILVRLEKEDRESLDDLDSLTVNPSSKHPIPLDAIADLVIGEGPSEVRRVDGQRVALVYANIADGSLGTAVSAIEHVLDNQVEFSDGFTYTIAGQSEEWERSQGSLLLALALSLFLVYVIMAAQFESLIHPFVIMFTIPLAFFGTVVGLKALQVPLSIVVFLGMIMLAGIVVNNAIVLIDYINTLKARGMELKEAIIQAGSVRLRPILMTTATTILGLLPMAFGLGDGAEIRTPMALAVIFGLITSTLLTLLLIPTIYYVVEAIGLKLFKKQPEVEKTVSDGPVQLPEGASV